MSAEATFIVKTELLKDAVQQRLNELCQGQKLDHFEVRPWTQGQVWINVGYIVGGEFFNAEYSILNRIICYLLSIASDEQVLYYRDPMAILDRWEKQPSTWDPLQQVNIHNLTPFMPDMQDANHEYVIDQGWSEYQRTTTPVDTR